jgi:predicted regulator of amino acid metabolism with ACT domain
MLQRISETFSIYPAQFEIISKALGKRFGIPHTFGFENVRHDVCEEASLVI